MNSCQADTTAHIIMCRRMGFERLHCSSVSMVIILHSTLDILHSWRISQTHAHSLQASNVLDFGASWKYGFSICYDPAEEYVCPAGGNADMLARNLCHSLIDPYGKIVKQFRVRG